MSSLKNTIFYLFFAYIEPQCNLKISSFDTNPPGNQLNIGIPRCTVLTVSENVQIIRSTPPFSVTTLKQKKKKKKHDVDRINRELTRTFSRSLSIKVVCLLLLTKTFTINSRFSSNWLTLISVCAKLRHYYWSENKWISKRINVGSVIAAEWFYVSMKSVWLGIKLYSEWNWLISFTIFFVNYYSNFS